MGGDYALLLTELLIDVPKELHEVYSFFPDQTTFESGFELYLKQGRYTEKRQANLIKKWHDFDSVAYKKQLAVNRIHFITIEDNQYPQRLKEIPFPPLVLFYKGTIELLREPCLGVVGTRHPSSYGKRCTETFCRGLANSFCIVSGLALGIDSIAHRAILEVSGMTIAVMPCSLDRCYPVRHQGLFDSIEKKGLLISEYPLKITALPYRIPQRNRLISGLSLGVLIVESKIKSGTLITARLAAEQNREVFTVPHPIGSDLGEGPHYLLKEGATLVTTVSDITDAFDHLCLTQAPVLPPPNLSPEEHRVWALLSQTPKPIEVLASELNCTISDLLQTISLLELKDLIEIGSEQSLKRCS